MKAENLVGEWIISDVLTDEINAPAGTVFKVVGYVLGANLAIVDAEHWGLERINAGRCRNRGM